MTDDEIAVEILDFLSVGSRSYNDLLRAWPTEPILDVDDTFQTLRSAGMVDRTEDDTAPSAWLTDHGRDLLQAAHTAAALPASAVKAAVVGRAIKAYRP